MNDKLTDFREDYVSTVVRYAQRTSQEAGRKISVLELCSGWGGLTELVLERLGGTDLKLYMADQSLSHMTMASSNLENWEENIVRLYRDIRDINRPLRFPFKETRKEVGLLHTGARWFYKRSHISEEIVEEGSIDLLIGQGPLTFIDPSNDGIQRTLDGTTKLLRSGGHAVILEGYNLTKEIVGKDISLGISPEQRERLFATNGMALIDGPRTYTITGRSPFHYNDVSVYRKK